MIGLALLNCHDLIRAECPFSLRLGILASMVNNQAVQVTVVVLCSKVELVVSDLNQVNFAKLLVRVGFTHHVDLLVILFFVCGFSHKNLRVCHAH